MLNSTLTKNRLGTVIRACIAFFILVVIADAKANSQSPAVGPLKIEIPKNAIPPQGMVDEHLVRAFAQDMLRAHETCGLDAVTFQKAIAHLQTLTAATDLESLAKIYVNAARCTHDAKVRPRGYESKSAVGYSDSLSIGVNYTTINRIKKVDVDVSSSESGSRSEETKVTYTGHISVSPDVLRAMQVAEDEAFSSIIASLKGNGYFLHSEASFYGVWRHRWGTIGFVDFTLESDNTFNAVLYRDKSDPSFEGLSNWGGGTWKVKDGKLTVHMDRVGRTWVPGSVKHDMTWFSQKLVLYVDANRIVFSDKSVLKRQVP